jgi:spoIIIJ-associated protein
MTESGNVRVKEFVIRFLENLLRAGHLSVQVRSREANGMLEMELDGPDNELLVENNARVLYAVEHVLNQVLYRNGFSESKVVVDCGGYRSSRVLELELMARKAAEKVRTTGAPFSLQPMPAVERRIIHLALAEDGTVRTESSGVGVNRHVIIFPGSTTSRRA